MKKPTTPKEITDKIVEMCSSICDSSPEYIPVKVCKGCKRNECFYNVAAHVKNNGGTIVYGWVVWQRANILIEAEAHAVWMNTNNELIDITPHNHNENTILFLKDDSVCYTGTIIPSHRIPLTTSPLVTEFIELFKKRDRMILNSKNDTYTIPTSDFYRMNYLEQRFCTSVERNDKCPCGSGLKYKRCCGQYE